MNDANNEEFTEITEITEQMELDLEDTKPKEKAKAKPEKEAKAKVSDVLQRVVIEANELKDKIDRLTDGLSNPVLTTQASTHLIEQRKYMIAYLDVLNDRIQSDYWEV